ncbi:MAG: PEP-CTERM sorting domain-containing protein, partial [Betaproteobacteria bacterium]
DTTGGGQINTGIDNLRTAAAIPEPETYAMMLAGLSLLGFVARRRKLKAV